MLLSSRISGGKVVMKLIGEIHEIAKEPEVYKDKKTISIGFMDKGPEKTRCDGEFRMQLPADAEILKKLVRDMKIEVEVHRIGNVFGTSRTVVGDVSIAK